MSTVTKKPKARKEPEALSAEQISEACASIRALHRFRMKCISSRIRITNERLAIVAMSLGYSAGLDEESREAMYDEARKVVLRVIESDVPHELSGLIKSMQFSVDGLETQEAAYAKRMVELVRKLPSADFSLHPKRRGFGLMSLATIIGECGDLSEYENPAKVWRRMGLAPWEYNGKTLMGSTWRSGKYGTLPAEQWEEYGYSPKRRSIAYVIGENMVKTNGDGPYRRMYDRVKEHKAADREFSMHMACKGTGKINGKKCPGCKGEGVTKRRAHLHAMLKATKALLLDLWLDWNGVSWQDWNERKSE